jgi:hypothetical protein
MKFDEHGHVVWTPKELYHLASTAPRRLVDGYLMTGTPWAFAEYAQFCAFLEAVAERTGVHPRNLYLRGSCQIGFSIAPKLKVWTALLEQSDLDLVIVDEGYFTRFEREVRWWEERNPADFLQGAASEAFIRRQRDRQFNCCWDQALPPAIRVHHRDTMRRVADMKHCGLRRRLSAFIYPDWLSARQRYLSDLRQLVEGVEASRLPRPGDKPVPVKSATSVPAQPTSPPPKSDAEPESGDTG